MYNNIILNNKFELIEGKIKYKITGIIFDDASIDVLDLPDAFANALKSYNIKTLSKFFMINEEFFNFINGYHKFSNKIIDDVGNKIKSFLNNLGNNEKIDTLSLNMNEVNALEEFFMKEDYITKEFMDNNKENIALEKIVKEHLQQRKIFEYKRGEYITLNGLHKLGYFKEDYSEFIDLCKEKTRIMVNDGVYDRYKVFTFRYIKSLNVHPRIFDLGFDDIFYSCILKYAVGIQSVKIGESQVFRFIASGMLKDRKISFSDKYLTATRALRSIIKENNIYDVDELHNWLRKNLFINVRNQTLLKHLIKKY